MGRLAGLLSMGWGTERESERGDREGEREGK